MGRKLFVDYSGRPSYDSLAMSTEAHRREQARTSPGRVTPVGWYAVLGITAILTTAMVRLTPHALAALRSDLTAFQAVAMAVSVVLMAYSEGYRGFQTRYSPRVVNRALNLGSEKFSGWTLIAPIVAMGLVRARKRVLITSWSLTCMIVIFVILLGKTAQPWRGIVDAGVVVGLFWGTTSILVFWGQALAGKFVRGDDGGLR